MALSVSQQAIVEIFFFFVLFCKVDQLCCGILVIYIDLFVMFHSELFDIHVSTCLCNT